MREYIHAPRHRLQSIWINYQNNTQDFRQLKQPHSKICLLTTTPGTPLSTDTLHEILPGIQTNLCMIIGIFGFYRNFLPLYDLDIQPYINILSKNPQLGKLSQKEEM